MILLPIHIAVSYQTGGTVILNRTAYCSISLTIFVTSFGLIYYCCVSLDLIAFWTWRSSSDPSSLFLLEPAVEGGDGAEEAAEAEVPDQRRHGAHPEANALEYEPGNVVVAYVKERALTLKTCGYNCFLGCPLHLQ